MSVSKGLIKLWSPHVVKYSAAAIKSEAVLYVLEQNALQDILSCEKAKTRIK